jgi:hypothetical protein
MAKYTVLEHAKEVLFAIRQRLDEALARVTGRHSLPQVAGQRRGEPGEGRKLVERGRHDR